MNDTNDLGRYSVLMSVYVKDSPEYLDMAVQSMVDQTVPFHDMVLVCDGPLTDSLDSIIAAWKEKLGERLIVVRLSENGGLGNALHEGLSSCECDIVARMDADDISRPERCEILLAAMHAYNLDLVGGAIEEFETVPGDLKVVRRPPEQKHEIKKYAARRNPFNHMSVLFRRHAVDEAGGYLPFYLLEDYWLWARMLARDCKCANVHDVVVDARVGTGMYGRRSSIAYLKSQYRFFREMRRLGISSFADSALTLSARAISAVVPTIGVRSIYTRYLRTRPK